MGDFESKLDSILNNPQAMSQIMSLAQSLGANKESADPVETPPAAGSNSEEPSFMDARLLSVVGSLFSQYNSNDDQRVALLNSLRPFVKEQRYAKLDKAIQIAKLSRVVRMAIDLLRSKEEPNV